MPIRITDNTCPLCGSKLSNYDKVKRIVRGRYGKAEYTMVKRKRCSNGHTIRVLPDYILPYKQYSKDAIEGFRDGIITKDTLGFEDYPSDLTVYIWFSHEFQFL